MFEIVYRFIDVLMRHSFSENVVGLMGAYFLFIYVPMRLLSIVFIPPIVNRYIEPPLRSTALMNAGMAGGFRVLELLGKKNNYHKFVIKPPRWLNNLLIYLLLNDLSMVVLMFAVALFYEK